MWWNRLALTLVMASLILNGIRLIRYWRVSHMIRVQPAILVVVMSILLVVLYTGVRWPLWFAGAGILLVLLYRLHPVGRMWHECEDIAALADIPYKEMQEFREKCEEQEEIEAAETARLDAIEEAQEAWAKAYRVEPVSRPVQVIGSLASPRWFPTTTGKLLQIDPGEISATFSDWQTNEDYAQSLQLRMTLSDRAGSQWTTSYWLAGRGVAELALAEEPQCQEVKGWTQVPSDWERCFRKHMLLTDAQFYMDGRDYYPLQVSGDDYVIREKHLSGYIDLAWNEASNRFLARIREVYFYTKNGVEASGFKEEDNPQWEACCIEPFAFEVPPEVLMPFSDEELPYRLDPDPANENHMSIWGGRKHHFCFGSADPSHRLIAFAPVGEANQSVGLLERDTSSWLSQPEE